LRAAVDEDEYAAPDQIPAERIMVNYAFQIARLEDVHGGGRRMAGRRQVVCANDDRTAPTTKTAIGIAVDAQEPSDQPPDLPAGCGAWSFSWFTMGVSITSDSTRTKISWLRTWDSTICNKPARQSAVA